MKCRNSVGWHRCEITLPERDHKASKAGTIKEIPFADEYSKTAADDSVASHVRYNSIDNRLQRQRAAVDLLKKESGEE